MERQRGFCPPNAAVQGYGYSIDGGASFVDAGDVPPLATGGRYRGDPVHAVNSRTGDFYICGLYEGGAMGAGVAVARGHFAGGTFVIDDNRQVAIGGSNFIDKEWMTVDPLTGNLYVTYSNFIQRDVQPDRADPLDGQRAHLGSAAGHELGGRVSDGCRARGRRSGRTARSTWRGTSNRSSTQSIFGSGDRTISARPSAPSTRSRSSTRTSSAARPGSGAAFASRSRIAVDRSNGPYRGRVYVSWDESVNFYDAPYHYAVLVSSAENDGLFASANPFTVGDVLRGSFSSTNDMDFFKFSGRGTNRSSAATDHRIRRPPSPGLRIDTATYDSIDFSP